MFDIMSEHYNALKGQLGLDEALAPSSEDEKDDYIQMISEQKKEFRRKMRQKRMELKDMLMKKKIDPIYDVN